MSRAVLHRWDDVPLEKVTEMVARKAISGASLHLVQVYIKKGSLVPWHQHSTEQLIYVLQGALRVDLGKDEITVREGEMLQLPPGTGHQAEALDDTFLLDVRGRPQRHPKDTGSLFT
jgi:quercetin dioxygenase-like cupin family protein